MRFATFESDLTAAGVSEEALVSIESNATAFYAQIAGLAENKIAYPVRELGSNAWDAAGGDVDISLPTQIDPVFSVRDYGPGLSHDFMMGSYARAYVSTKREDANKIGGWGLGRFSPFAYLLSDDQAGMYTISSWHGGEKRDYIMAIESDGIPRIKLLNTVASDERSGLKVSFSVLAKDIDGFRQAAYDIFWSFEPRPRITPEIDFDDTPALSQGDGWRVYPVSHKTITCPHVLLGCVLYRIDMKNPDLVIPKMIRQETRILFQAQGGSLRPTLSREDLAYTTGTVKTLSALMQGYADTVVGALQHQIDRADSIAHASLMVENAGESLTLAGRDDLRSAVRWSNTRIYAVLKSDKTARYCRLPKGWSDREITEFEGCDMPMSAWKDHRVAIETSTGHSIAKLKAAGLEGQPVLWVRSLARDKGFALARIGSPKEVVDLDDFKSAVRNLKPKTVRKRIFWRFPIMGGPKRETIETDLSAVQYYARVDRSNAWHHRFQTTGDRYDPLGAVSNLVSVAMQLRVFPGEPTGVLALPINRDQETVPDNWQPFVPWVISLLEPRFDPTQLSPHLVPPGLPVSPHELRYLHTFPRPPLQKAPAEIASVILELWEAVRHIRNGIPGRRQTESDRIWEVLAAVGHRPVERPQAPGAAKDLMARWNEINKRHPLISHIVGSHHYGWDTGSVDRALGPIEREYERLLRLDAKSKDSTIG